LSENAAVTAYRAEVRRALGLADDLPLDAFAFGDGGALADELAELVVNGPKRATVGWIAEAETLGEHLPKPGDYWIILDGAGRPRCTIRTAETFEAPLLAVDDRFAWDEGEGDRTRAWWLEAHRRYFARRAAELGLAFDEAASPLLYERFEVVHRAGAAEPSNQPAGRHGD
jgi:uncharacterized protein YhfF